MTLIDDLKAARALIDTPEKWRKDEVSWDEHSCCAVIATNRARPGNHLNVEAWHALRDALPADWVGQNIERLSDDEGLDLRAYHGVLVGHYNDDPATTHNDILALFDRAIDAATLSQQKEASK